MKLNMHIPVLSLFLITACASTEYMPPNDLGINSDHFRALREPSLYEISIRKPLTEQYRLTVLSGVTPVHSVRVKVNPDGSGEAIVKVAKLGTRIQRKNYLNSRQLLDVSMREIGQLRSSFEELSFQEIYPDQTSNEEEFWIHPTLICYEATRDGQYHIVCDSTGNVTKITQILLPQFYRLGDVNSESDWSLYEWFGLDKIE